MIIINHKGMSSRKTENLPGMPTAEPEEKNGNGKRYLVLGDSHTEVFQYINQVNLTNAKKTESSPSKSPSPSPFDTFEVCTVSGGTAQGLVNPNSKSNALATFRNFLSLQRDQKRRFDRVFLMLGEVDCAFLIWYRSAKYSISVDTQIQSCVQNVCRFAQEVLVKEHSYRPEQVVLLGAVLPTVADDVDRRLLYAHRQKVTASQMERTLKTLEYNARLSSASAEHHFRYLDITSYILGPNGLVLPEFLRANPGDNHLANEPAAHAWKRAIAQLESR